MRSELGRYRTNREQDPSATTVPRSRPPHIVRSGVTRAGRAYTFWCVGLAFAIALALIVPASIFALSHERARIAAGPDPTAAGEDPVPTVSAAARRGQEPGAALVGLWKVEAEGEGTETWVAFTPRGVTVERDRRLISASWVTGDNRIGAVVGSWDGALTDHSVPWLEDAGTFAREGAEFLLQAPDGSVLASLTPARGAPAPRSASADSMSVSTSGAGSAFSLPVAPAAPGPALSPEELTGRWRTGDAAADGSRPFITFAADGTYRGSDGCDGISGKWLLLPGNRLVFTSSGRTQVGCGNLQPVPEWTEATRSVSVVSGALTLFDVDGTPLGSFDRRERRTVDQCECGPRTDSPRADWSGLTRSGSASPAWSRRPGATHGRRGGRRRRCRPGARS